MKNDDDVKLLFKNCYFAGLMGNPNNAFDDFDQWYASKQKEVKKLHLHSVSGSVLNINLHEYGHSCGDGCCYNYGTITTVNKTELPCHNQDAGTILRQVLEHLGYCVEITYSDDVS